MPAFNFQDVFFILGVGFCFGMLWGIHNKLHDILQELRYLNAPRTPQKRVQAKPKMGSRVYVSTPMGYDNDSYVD